MPPRGRRLAAKKAGTSSSTPLAKARKDRHSVEWFGDKTVHTTEASVEDVGKGTKVVAGEDRRWHKEPSMFPSMPP